MSARAEHQGDTLGTCENCGSPMHVTDEWCRECGADESLDQSLEALMRGGWIRRTGTGTEGDPRVYFATERALEMPNAPSPTTDEQSDIPF
jgi:hypothetical protein